MDLTESVDEFEVFNQPPSPKSLPEEISIQRKPQKSLLELIENQPGNGGPEKSAQPKCPPPPSKSPPRAPPPTFPNSNRDYQGIIVWLYDSQFIYT